MQARRRFSEASGDELNNFVYSATLGACVGCKDLKAAEGIMDQTRQADLIDVVSFNMLLNAYLKFGNFAKGACIGWGDGEGGLPAEQCYFQRIHQREDRLGPVMGFPRDLGHRGRDGCGDRLRPGRRSKTCR